MDPGTDGMGMKMERGRGGGSVENEGTSLVIRSHCNKKKFYKLNMSQFRR